MNDSSSAGKSNVNANIAYDDLREWLALAELLGEVRNVKGASWQEDIGLAAEAILREENGPCVVFDEVPGSPKGFRVLLNMFAGVRRNMTLGFPDHLTKWELSDAFREAYLKEQKPIPHEIVEDGPIFENIITGDAIDVTKFPSPVWHELDGGRYIGTGTYSITRDPEENWLNAGAYGGLEAPYGVFEIDVVGGLRGKAMQMVKGKITGLPFPAGAEIVLEGYVTPEKRVV